MWRNHINLSNINVADSFITVPVKTDGLGHQEVIRLPKNRIHAAICMQAIVNAKTNRIFVRGMILPGAPQ